MAGVFAMTEQEKFECFGIPAHVWVESFDMPLRKPVGWFRRNWVYREVAMLGAEALPSPQTPSLKLVR
jgi:hypothetical protein